MEIFFNFKLIQNNIANMTVGYHFSLKLEKLVNDARVLSNLAVNTHTILQIALITATSFEIFPEALELAVKDIQ